ncbi:MAG TPA: thioredoxin domain-containing protein, partial [Gammaproteobacteria bacterium]|nr:thioredoxin domain-containing protein [Gammaproteobacteria bacterium]
MRMTTHENALIHETSPYLQQHAHNPVHWYPWSEEALQRAREEDKPILLSIGYSACHWCHVMAHESFEDEETAAIMNELFINIKVDREERPDLDKIYQVSQQLLTQRTGGWPLTMFLTPEDQLPFFGGTYFPPEPRYGMPGFRDLLQRVAGFYREKRDDINRQNQSMQEALQRISETAAADAGTQLTHYPLTVALQQLQQSFDERNGGFGGAPKFPHPTNIERLLRHQQREPANTQSRIMTETTLRKMAEGGVYDQVGGGFYRYSVDEQWMIPHFEKMLYDNGPLLRVYSQAYQLTGNVFYQKIATETAEWVLRDMQSAEGGYYSTIDADSEGHEGKFYIWDKAELQQLLDESLYEVVAKYLGLEQPANFEGHWHLYVTTPLKTVADELSISREEAEKRLKKARAILLQTRNKRVWPGRDEKILTSWNGLMIKAMATAATVFNEPRYHDSACRSVAFIRETLWQDGRMLATYKDGKAHLNAYLDDYAFIIDGILALLGFRWNSDSLAFAIQLTEAMLDKFEDQENGGFFFTSHDHEKLIQRHKPMMDDALPAGNGIAASVLL